MRAGLFCLHVSLAVLLSGCLSTLMGTKESRSGDYQVPKPGPDWTPIDPGEGDRAYRNPRDQAVFNITSVCGEGRYQTLEALSTDILKQLPEHEIIEPSKAAVIGGHPGLITEARGVVDGKPVNVRLAVVRTNKCLYDFILAGPNLDPSSRVAFEASLQGFRDKAR